MNPSAEQSSVLVVDDSPESLDVMRHTLREDYRVRVAINGARALEIAGGEDPPVAILLDVMMPGMNGFEVCRQLSANPQTRHIPVIFVTSLANLKDEQRGFEAGAVDYITKPYNPSIVRSRVRAHVAASRAASGWRPRAIGGGDASAEKREDERAMLHWSLECLARLAQAAGSEDSAQLADEIRLALVEGRGVEGLMRALDTAIGLYQLPPARVAEVEPEVGADGLDRAKLASEIARIRTSIETGDGSIEPAVRQLVETLRGTMYVRMAEKVLFAARGDRPAQAAAELGALARSLGAESG
jgi:CheY-like chemotaxis protein